MNSRYIYTCAQIIQKKLRAGATNCCHPHCIYRHFLKKIHAIRALYVTLGAKDSGAKDSNSHWPSILITNLLCHEILSGTCQSYIWPKQIWCSFCQLKKYQASIIYQNSMANRRARYHLANLGFWSMALFHVLNDNATFCYTFRRFRCGRWRGSGCSAFCCSTWSLKQFHSTKTFEFLRILYDTPWAVSSHKEQNQNSIIRTLPEWKITCASTRNGEKLHTSN